MTLLFHIVAHSRGASEFCRSTMRRLVVHTLIPFLIAAVGVKAFGAESDYYKRFEKAADVEASRSMAHVLDSSSAHLEDGYIVDSSLVDTNSSGPILTNAPVSYAGFTIRGELAGIKLGMTMSEVVAAWGRPKRLFTNWLGGPRFWYGPRDELWLSFSGDRLVYIGISGMLAERITFDNGLTGTMGRVESERLLGAPALRDIDDTKLAALQGTNAHRWLHIGSDPAFGTNTQGWIYLGRHAYRAGKLRTDISFKRALVGGLLGPTEHLYLISVSFEGEVRFEGIVQIVEPQGGANGRQPTRSETNRTSPAAASRRSP